MVEALVRFLFKYPPLIFEQAEFAFSQSRSMMLTIGIIGLGAAAVLVTAASRRIDHNPSREAQPAPGVLLPDVASGSA